MQTMVVFSIFVLMVGTNAAKKNHTDFEQYISNRTNDLLFFKTIPTCMTQTFWAFERTKLATSAQGSLGCPDTITIIFHGRALERKNWGKKSACLCHRKQHPN